MQQVPLEHTNGPDKHANMYVSKGRTFFMLLLLLIFCTSQVENYANNIRVCCLKNNGFLKDNFSIFLHLNR